MNTDFSAPSPAPAPGGDPHTAVFQRHRARLAAIAYRMLGSRADADDAVQDAWLRWQATPAERIETAEAWLVATLTRLCVDRLRSARTEREAYSGPWLPGPWIGAEAAPAADARAELASDLSVALLVLLERLTPDERAAFLLHDVFDSDYPEVASVLGRSEAACRQLVHRARTQMRQHKARFTATPEAARALVARFLEGMRTQNHAELLALFSEDALWTADGGGRVRAASKVLRGPRALTRLAVAVWRHYLGGHRIEATPVNGGPGLLVRAADGSVQSVMAFDTDGVRIRAVYSMLNPDKLRGL
ncbi:RNA polymerase sigma factor SigJ [Acidovorax sp. GBBC 3334]|uniref:RNA polymerase sigma factor SigJ n=1 Tax=Acidovorax sp. GBBC 3334 TaxID=2940496 RepID=UPI002303E5E9|nr:RNA polymerase sigma factor SigJ [Acidovorax sp. GBBC 3334]MDA8456343.1 RNA polymerase sigma factor SigJ [Acidovorax sp. GBBC 3334]